jgi:hypothetical protein
VTHAIRPAGVCAWLLAALDASEGRSRRRKRDQTPDRIGLEIKRGLLAAVVRDDPAPEAFEGWLLERCLAAEANAGVGAVRAMASDLLVEWRLAQVSVPFRAWLAKGAPSDDAQGEPPSNREVGSPPGSQLDTSPGSMSSG